MSESLRRLASWLEQPRGSRTARITFGCYTVVLLGLTLWPALEVPIPIHRSDLVAHMTFFGAFGLLASAAGLFGPPLSEGNLLRTLLAAAIFAGADEALQAVPALHRTAALDDYAANLMGLGVAAACMLLWRGRLGNQPTL